jgi:hypothetical protein
MPLKNLPPGDERLCKWCREPFLPQTKQQRTCGDPDCEAEYNGLIDDFTPVSDEEPEWPTTEEVISQVGRVLAEEDPIAMVDKFNSKYPTPGVNNGIWWRMNSWREKMPQGYGAAPCSDCGHPVAKPLSLTESVACERCEPPEIL